MGDALKELLELTDAQSKEIQVILKQQLEAPPEEPKVGTTVKTK